MVYKSFINKLFFILLKYIIEYWFNCLSFSIITNFFISFSISIFLSTVLFSFIFMIKYALLIWIGSDTSPVFNFIISSNIFFEIWVWLVQPILPPNFDESDILKLFAAFSKLFIFIKFLILLNFSVTFSPVFSSKRISLKLNSSILFSFNCWFNFLLSLFSSTLIFLLYLS